MSYPGGGRSRRGSAPRLRLEHAGSHRGRELGRLLFTDGWTRSGQLERRECQERQQEAFAASFSQTDQGGDHLNGSAYIGRPTPAANIAEVNKAKIPAYGSGKVTGGGIQITGPIDTKDDCGTTSS